MISYGASSVVRDEAHTARRAAATVHIATATAYHSAATAHRAACTAHAAASTAHPAAATAHRAIHDVATRAHPTAACARRRRQRQRFACHTQRFSGQAVAAARRRLLSLPEDTRFELEHQTDRGRLPSLSEF